MHKVNYEVDVEGGVKQIKGKLQEDEEVTKGGGGWVESARDDDGFTTWPDNHSHSPPSPGPIPHL